jgi:hypothetical protein
MRAPAYLLNLLCSVAGNTGRAAVWFRTGAFAACILFSLVQQEDPAMGTSGIMNIVLSILLFPVYFQRAFIDFAWGAGDELWILLGKRLFLMLPVLAIILGCWTSVACVLTVPIRQNRREFVTTLFITWWDLGKSIVFFWGGIFKMLFSLIVALLGLVRIILFGIWAVVQDIVFIPFGILRRAVQIVMSSPVPWIAVLLTLAWCFIETTIFTYVMTPLVMDTFSNITGQQLTETFVRFPLFLFLLFVVLGSYAVLSTFVDSVKSKSFSTILGIGVIEVVVLFVEVVFLYREFVDSLVPWFAQYSANFELGIFWTLAISCFVWFGIRSLSWFLFAAHGTPTIMRVIQGQGIKVAGRTRATRGRFFEVSGEFWDKIRAESEWGRKTGEELLASFMLPPLQVVAASINFCTLLVITSHLFPLPFKDISAVKYSEQLISALSQKRRDVWSEEAR